MKKRFFSMLFILALCFAVTVSAFAEAVQYIGIGTREITLTGSGASFSCEGVRAEGSVITIFEPGEYTVSGTLDDGQIIVDTGYSIEKTSITLSGASVTCLNDAAIYVRQAEKVKIYMAEGTENTVTSGKEEMLAAFSKDNTGAAIYAEDDLDIKGPGVLLVNGYINNGIMCKDDLDLDGGTLIVFAANNGIRGSESIEIHDGNLTVECGNDALKTTSTKVGKGFIEIDSGKNLLQAGGNGISAQTDVTVLGGETVIESQKTPVKLGGNLSVSGGSLIGNGVAF
ncbi:MAG: carbohydrate-binding domain-containing protein [Oscillospiraceae bacterium]|nr:carbohydrate-binding domain-containing protein [Oscillospiraceae bacterium]